MKVEIRNDSVEISGYVNVVQRDSRILPSARGKFVEQIEARTFDKALGRTDNVNLLFNHKEDRKLGSTSEGNLTLYEDSIGLKATCTVTDDEVMNKAKNGELRGWSFGFICHEDKWVDGDIQRRYISDLDLLEVSILDMTPAYVGTSIEARGEETLVKEQRYEEVISETVRTTVVTEKVKEVDGERVYETVRETTTDAPDYTYYDMSIEIIKYKGGNY